MRAMTWRRARISLLACGVAWFVACAPGGPAPSGPPRAPVVPASGPAASVAPTSPTTVRVAVPTMDIDYTLPLSVAEKRGYFREAGVEMDLREMPSTPATAALINRELEFACSGCVFLGAARGADVRYLFGPYYTSNFQFAVNPEKVREPKDLVGQTIAIAGPGNSQDVATRRIIESLGVDPTMVGYVAMGGSSGRVAGLMSGQIAGSALLPDVAIRLRREGFAIVGNSTQLMVVPQGGFGTHVDLLKDSRATVKQWIRPMIRALVYIQANPDEAVEILADYTQLDRELLLEAVPIVTAAMSRADPGGSTERELQEALKLATDPDPELRGKDFPLDRVVEFGPLREVQRDLGIHCQGGYACQ